MKHKHIKISLGLLLLLIIVSQAVTIYIVYTKNQETLEKLNEMISLSEAETHAKINELSSAISSVSSAQSDLTEQLSELKAEASSDFSGIIEGAVHGVVTIKTDISQGTGFIITDDGFVVTNYHVMQGAKAAGVFTYDGEVHQVSLVGSNANMDIALLKIEGNFDELDLGNSDDVKIGDRVIAIGNPLGLSFTATEGIISGRNREGINELPYYFQTDVALNPGNSGGPLIDTRGDVIGINNFKVSGADNIGFALEINYAKKTINDISANALNMSVV